jgi:hypothetical protein
LLEQDDAGNQFPAACTMSVQQRAARPQALAQARSKASPG